MVMIGESPFVNGINWGEYFPLYPRLSMVTIGDNQIGRRLLGMLDMTDGLQGVNVYHILSMTIGEKIIYPRLSMVTIGKGIIHFTPVCQW